MPQVPGSPYEPYESVMPAERVLRPGGVPMVPDAFGAGIARAVSTFGGDLEHAAGEVFDRALALRKLDIDGQVRDQTTALTNAQAAKSLEFQTAHGDNANQAAMDAHLKEMEDMHQDYRQRLANQGVGPYGLNRFDDEYASMQRSFTRAAIGHSRTEIQKGQLTSIDNEREALSNSVQMSPFDDELWNSTVKKVKKSGDVAGDILGHDAELSKYETGQVISKMAAARVAA